MKALITGFFGGIAALLALGFFIQNPAIFWIVLSVVLGVFALAVWSGTRKKTPADPERAKRRNAAFGRQDGISEGDIVHHHQPNGRPFEDGGNPGSLLGAAAAGAAAAYILKPDSKEVVPVVEPDPEIENAAEMYYEGNDSYSEEEGEY
jgi:hypothetical protein